MAYAKQTWTDRLVEFVRRYRDQNNVQYTFTPDEGVVTEEGTHVAALRMNHMEQGIYDAHEAVAQEVIDRAVDVATRVPLTEKGAASGVATLDTGAKVPSSQLGNAIAAINASSEQWELLATKTFSSDATYFSFSNIPTNYKRLKALFYGFSYESGVAQLLMRVNGVSSASYHYGLRNSAGFTQAGSQTAFVVPGAIPNFGINAKIEINIENYAPLDLLCDIKAKHVYDNIELAGRMNYLGTALTSLYFEGKFDAGNSFAQLYGSVL